MLPMIATMTEVERARDAVAQVRAELKERGTESGPISAVPVGALAYVVYHVEQGGLEIGVEAGYFGVVPIRRQQVLGQIVGAVRSANAAR